MIPRFFYSFFLFHNEIRLLKGSWVIIFLQEKYVLQIHYRYCKYFDAFCGRVPRSILGRHYTDYSPERLKEIFEKANLKVMD